MSKLKKMTRKQRVRIIVYGFIIVVILIHLIHAVTLDRIVQYREISFSHPNIPAGLNGYTIVFVTDTHDNSERRLRGIVERLSDKEIDLLLLGGDYSENGGETCMEILSQVQTSDGIFGIEGNHDIFSNLYENMERHNITPLSTTGLHIHDGFFLAGTAESNRNTANAISGADDGDFVLLVAHNPDIALGQNRTNDVDLILSGHTHGGNTTFFGVFAPGLWFVTNSGHRFKSGWAESDDGTSMFICNGVGQYFPRVFARPQVTILTLISE